MTCLHYKAFDTCTKNNYNPNACISLRILNLNSVTVAPIERYVSKLRFKNDLLKYITAQINRYLVAIRWMFVNVLVISFLLKLVFTYSLKFCLGDPAFIFSDKLAIIFIPLRDPRTGFEQVR